MGLVFLQASIPLILKMWGHVIIFYQIKSYSAEKLNTDKQMQGNISHLLQYFTLSWY